MKDCVLTHVRDGILTITLNRPEKMNALNLELLQALIESTEFAKTNENVKGIILTGAGGNFCAGADIELIEQTTSANVWRNTLLECKRLIEAIRHMPKPVISKVEGYAAGAGCNIALSADFVVSSDSAWFYEAFIHLGAIVDCGGTYLLPRLVGMAKAKAMALLGEKVSAKEAERIGLIYKCAPSSNLDSEVRSLMERLISLSPLAYRTIKAGLERSLDMTLEQVLEWEYANQPMILLEPSVKEAVRKLRGRDERRSVKEVSK